MAYLLWRAVRSFRTAKQDLARLFVRSGWTQEALAAKEKKSRQWRHLLSDRRTASASKHKTKLIVRAFRRE
jgi:hypothetical protein